MRKAIVHWKWRMLWRHHGTRRQTMTGGGRMRLRTETHKKKQGKFVVSVLLLGNLWMEDRFPLRSDVFLRTKEVPGAPFLPLPFCQDSSPVSVPNTSKEGWHEAWNQLQDESADSLTGFDRKRNQWRHSHVKDDELQGDTRWVEQPATPSSRYWRKPTNQTRESRSRQDFAWPSTSPAARRASWSTLVACRTTGNGCSNIPETTSDVVRNRGYKHLKGTQHTGNRRHSDVRVGRDERNRLSKNTSTLHHVSLLPHLLGQSGREYKGHFWPQIGYIFWTTNHQCPFNRTWRHLMSPGKWFPGKFVTCPFLFSSVQGMAWQR